MSIGTGLWPKAWLMAAAAMILLLPAFATPASASKRVALVIGNAQYEYATLLANPLNDAADIGDAFGRLGFEVTRIENADQFALRRGLHEFTRAASAAEMAVVFYAGHGIEVENRNFLVPVDASLKSDTDIEFEAVALDLVERAAAGARDLSLIILDACRDNPFANSMQRDKTSRSIGRGLARVSPSGDMLIAYAAKEGTTADDGKGRNSPYTEALLSYIEKPGLDVMRMFGRVGGKVKQLTNGKQEPVVYGSPPSKDLFLASPVLPPPVDYGTVDKGRELDLAARAYEAAERVGTIEAYQLVISQFPGTIYARLAQSQIKKLAEHAALTEPPRVSPEPEVPTPPQEPVPDSGEPAEGRPSPVSLSSLAALGLGLAEWKQVQHGLKALGFDPGPIDGLLGPSTVAALKAWREAKRYGATDPFTRQHAEALTAVASLDDPTKPLDDSPLDEQGPVVAKPTEPPTASDDLHALVQAGDGDGVKAALAAGANADINARDGHGMTPLMHAAQEGHSLLIGPLLEAGSDLDIQATNGATALFLAVQHGHEDIARTLIRAGADISIRGPMGGKSPLEVAQFRGSQRTVTLLQEAGDDRKAYLAAQQSDTAAGYDRYIKSFPDGLFVQQARQRLAIARDREAFRKATILRTAKAIRDYVRNFPNGAHLEAAKKLATKLDTEEYARALEEDTSASYAKYAISNPDGLHIVEAKERERKAADREMFQRAQTLNTIEALEDYLEAKPDGSYRAQARAMIKDLREPIVFKKAIALNTVEAFEEYLESYPDGPNAGKAVQQVAQIRVIGKEFHDCPNCPEMVVVPPGSFMMGSSETEVETGGKSYKLPQHEMPRHRVTITEPFAVGKYEVTLKEFGEFVRATNRDMGEDAGFFGSKCASRYFSLALSNKHWRDPGYEQDDRSPVTCISWEDAVDYTNWLSRETGQPYRLLSESEWEYTARASTQTLFHFGNSLSSTKANYDSMHNIEFSDDRGFHEKATRVGSFRPNQFGLHDMHGNLLELVTDCWHENYEGAPRDSRAWISGGDCKLRVARGGAWIHRASLLRSAYRTAVKEKDRYNHYGFRVARAIDPPVLYSKLTSSLASAEEQ